MAREYGIGVLFREVQYFRQLWIWFLILAIAGFSIYAVVQQLLLDKPFGNNPAPDAILIVIVVIFGFGFPTLFYRINLTTEVHSDGLYYRFFPFNCSFRRIPLEDLTTYEVRTRRMGYQVWRQGKGI
jgi:hypothetical protein